MCVTNEEVLSLLMLPFVDGEFSGHPASLRLCFLFASGAVVAHVIDNFGDEWALVAMQFPLPLEREPTVDKLPSVLSSPKSSQIHFCGGGLLTR